MFALTFELGADDGSVLKMDLSALNDVDGVVPALKVVFLLTILALAPAALLMATSFTRILIVLGFVRQALGTQTMPPNQVVIGLALFLTMFTMSPMVSVISDKALTPYLEKKISQDQAIDEVIRPVKKFMLSETRRDDLAMFLQLSNGDQPESRQDVPMTTLMPSFMISELKTAFQMGFLVYIPFLIIDMVISSILMAMGMMMLPPTVVSLPFKLILFVLVDGWSLIVSSLVRSFAIFGA